MCHHCEGEVDLDVIVCPYCAADLREEKIEHQRSSFSAAAHSVKSLGVEPSSYTPPPIFQPTIASPKEESGEEMHLPREPEAHGVKPHLFAVALIAVGAQLFLLSLLLLLFGSDGVLILKWDARLWFLYLFASVPLLFFGYRSLAKMSD